MPSEPLPTSLATGKPDAVYAEMTRASAHVERVGRALAARLAREGFNRHEAQASLAFARAVLDCWFDRKTRGDGHV